MRARRVSWRAVAPLFAIAGCHVFDPQVSEPPQPAPSAAAPASEPVVLPPLEDAGAAPAPAEPEEPGVVQGVGPTRGVVPKAAVDAEMRRALPAFRACYERAVSERPVPRATILVEFVVATDGSVPYAAANDAGTDLENEAVVDCVLEETAKLVFPAPSGGRAFVRYPLVFEPPASP